MEGAAEIKKRLWETVSQFAMRYHYWLKENNVGGCSFEIASGGYVHVICFVKHEMLDFRYDLGDAPDGASLSIELEVPSRISESCLTHLAELVKNLGCQMAEFADVHVGVVFFYNANKR